jgi:hypothetical protein
LEQITFEDRLEHESSEFNDNIVNEGGIRAITFNPKSATKKSGGEQQRQRRSASKSKLYGK